MVFELEYQLYGIKEKDISLLKAPENEENVLLVISWIKIAKLKVKTTKATFFLHYKKYDAILIYEIIFMFCN